MILTSAIVIARFAELFVFGRITVLKGEISDLKGHLTIILLQVRVFQSAGASRSAEVSSELPQERCKITKEWDIGERYNVIFSFVCT